MSHTQSLSHTFSLSQTHSLSLANTLSLAHTHTLPLSLSRTHTLSRFLHESNTYSVQMSSNTIVFKSNQLTVCRYAFKSVHMMYVSHCGSLATSSSSAFSDRVVLPSSLASALTGFFFDGVTLAGVFLINWKFFSIALPNVCLHLVIQVSGGSGGFDVKCASRIVLTIGSKAFSNASTMMDKVARPKWIRLNGLEGLDNDMVLLNPKRARKQEHAASIHKSQHRNGLCLFCRLVYLYMYNVKAAFGWKCLWFKTWCYTYGGVFFV